MGGLSHDPAKRQRQLDALTKGRQKLGRIELGQEPRPKREPKPDPHTAPPVTHESHTEDGIDVLTYKDPPPAPPAPPADDQHPTEEASHDDPAPRRPSGFLGGFKHGARR